MLAASLLLVLGLAGAPTPNPTVERATRAYQAGRLAEACRLFQQAADAAPLDGERWADLGLCLGKLGRPEVAIAAERKAASLGGPETRLHAYYNLDRLGARLAPSIPAEGCALVPSTGSCRESLSACAYTDPSASGTGVIDESAGWAFCPQGVDREGFPPYARSIAQLECSSLELRSFTQNKCRPGDVGGAECGACGCERAPDPEACERAVQACQATGPDERERRCTLVWIDACRHRVGAVCVGADGKRIAVESAPQALPAPFDAFTPVDLYRGLHGEPPRTPDPDLDAVGWLQGQQVLDRSGGKVLVTVTAGTGRGTVTSTWALDHGRLTLVTSEGPPASPAGR